MTTPATPAAAAPITASSDFSYTPPPEADPSEIADFDQSIKDVISEIEGEYHPAPEFADDPDAGGEAKAADDPDAGGELAAPVEDDPAVARGMERLVSREVALQAKENEFRTREARVASLEQELASLRRAVPAKEIQEKLSHSPTEAIKALGHDPETIVRLMIAEQLEAKGQEVPPALKEFVKEAATQRKFKALEEQLASRQRADEHAAFFNTVALGAREYVKTVDSKQMPTLAGIATANPDRAHREIMEEISNDARSRMAADPNGQPITYQEAAKRVETRLAELKGLFGPTQNDPKKPAQNGKPPTPPAQKPPVRPLKPWEKKGDDIYAQAIKDAEREFYAAEARSKARR